MNPGMVASRASGSGLHSILLSATCNTVFSVLRVLANRRRACCDGCWVDHEYCYGYS